jgi:BirA family transcriptional regulator, biotin operon repressor / biotin---[acetyl-CoA-carboxylase] ligase
MKFKIHKFKRVSSTNDKAINLIKKQKSENGYVFSYIQTNGRGTRGKKWISVKGNLFSSLFFCLKKEYPPFNEFSIINPVIIADIIKKFTKKKNINLKFPNDLFLNGKKVCGLLQEVITVKNKKFLIIGIGLNLISNPIIKKSYQATNIFFETKKKPSLNKINDLIISSYKSFFTDLKLYDFKNFKKKANLMAIN